MLYMIILILVLLIISQSFKIMQLKNDYNIAHTKRRFTETLLLNIFMLSCEFFSNENSKSVLKNATKITINELNAEVIGDLDEFVDNMYKAAMKDKKWYL